MTVNLRAVSASDLPIFFELEADPEARHMAAFVASDPTDRAAFDAHWAHIMADPGSVIQTILSNGQVAGHIESFELLGLPSVGYWLGKSFWGQGIATRALQLFLAQVTTRPIYARAAYDNRASIRVLEKCGFVISGEDKAFAAARNAEIMEYVLTLEA